MTSEELLKTAKPILFNTDMVRAILDGRKTETRRCIKPRYKDDEIGFNVITNAADGSFVRVEKYDEWESTFDKNGRERIVNPPYNPGDILYVRETWQYLYEMDGNEQITDWNGKYFYAATDTLPDGGYVDSSGITHDIIPWRPSIHMPKEAARIFLRVTDVRVEQLQDIDDDGAKAEGANYRNGKNIGWEEKIRRSAIERFKEIWNSTIPKKQLDEYGWDANPFVWVIEFERLKVKL